MAGKLMTTLQHTLRGGT